MSEKKIGRYEIKSELGRGGMATVYLAYDPVLERDVALKLLPNYFAHDPEFSARFEREAKTVAALEHGSIVSMYDYGEDGEWPYFVMRLMKGGSLKDRVAKGPMSLAEAARIVSRVAGALDKAHSKDIVHRDLKPGNIMFDEDGAAYLGDFGIVKLAESSESYTRTGNTLGTPAYMSPEQADGNPNIDGRSDIYSLGIILYEMLAGSQPFTHESMPRLLIMHLTAPIPDIRQARPDLPAGVQAVIEKAMAKDRDERYATAGELAEAVQAVLAGGKEAAVSTKAAPVAASEPEPVSTRSAPAVAIEPEPAVATAVNQTTEPVAATKPEPKPATAVKPAPAQPKAAKSGGIPKWIYAVVGVVVVAIIGVLALSGGGDDLDDLPEEPPAADVRSEEVVVEADAPAEEPPQVEPTVVVEEVEEPVDASLSSQFDPDFNYFDDPDLWEILLDEGTDIIIEDGRAIFTSQLDGSAWGNYLETFSDGTYEVEVTALSAEPGNDGFGMLFMYDKESWSWYEFLVDADGSVLINYCEDACDTVDESLLGDWIYDEAINSGIGTTNLIRVEANQGELTFYVNDMEIGSAFDDRRTSGNIGIIVYNHAEESVDELEVVFDNFTFTPAP